MYLSSMIRNWKYFLVWSSIQVIHSFSILKCRCWQHHADDNEHMLSQELSFNHKPGKESSENIKSMFHICFDSSLQIKWYVECVVLIRWFHMGLGRVSFHGSFIHLNLKPDQGSVRRDESSYDGPRLSSSSGTGTTGTSTTVPLKCQQKLSHFQKWSTYLYLSIPSSFCQSLMAYFPSLDLSWTETISDMHVKLNNCAFSS